MKELKLIKKSVYGRVMTYPNCEISKCLVELTKGKTFSVDDLTALERAGFTLAIEAAV